MHAITLKAAFDAFAQLEREVFLYEQEHDASVYDVTKGQGNYERQEIVYDVAQGIDADVVALVNSERYTAIEIVYGVGDAIASALMASLNELYCFDEASVINALRSGFKNGLITL